MVPIIVGWVLSGDDTIPGARIHGTNLHKFLVRNGVESHILRQPEGLKENLSDAEVDDICRLCAEKKINVLILQKVNGEAAVSLCQRQAGRGVLRVFLACDTVDNTLAAACDRVITVSTFLRNLFYRKLRPKIHVLHDAIEVPETYRDHQKQISRDGRLTGVYLASSYPGQNLLRMLALCSEFIDVTVVSAPPKDSASQTRTSASAPGGGVRAFVREHGLKAVERVVRKAFYAARSRRLMSGFPEPDPRIRFIPWDITTVSDVISRADFGIIPVDLDSTFAMAKSANRLSTMLAMGLAVIASPVPSYLEAFRPGRHFLVAATAREWRNRLSGIVSDRRFVQQLADNGKDFVWKNHTIEVVGREFIRIVSLDRN